MQRAIDISNWQGNLSSAVANMLFNEQVAVSVQAVYGENGEYTRQQLSMLRSVDYRPPMLDAYIWWHPLETDLTYTNQRLDLLEGFGIEEVWIDVEDTSALSIGIDQRVLRLGQTLAAVEARGYRAGIYSAAWYWPKYMANTTVFNSRPLWSVGSKYDGGYGEPPDTLDLVVPYGGWTKAAGIQYTSTGYVDGYGPVDMSVWENIVTDDQKRWLTSLVNTSVIVLIGGDVRDLSAEDKTALKELSDAAQQPY